jgi:hypothetical protein
MVTVQGWRASMSDPHAFCLRIPPPMSMKGSATSLEDVEAGVEPLDRVLEATMAAQSEQWQAFRQIPCLDDQR